MGDDQQRREEKRRAPVDSRKTKQGRNKAVRKTVQASKRLTAMLLTVLLLSALLPLSVFAVCAHTWNTCCDASHPHEQYNIAQNAVPSSIWAPM